MSGLDPRVVSRIASRAPAVVRLASALSRSDLLWVANTSHGPGAHWRARVTGDEPDHDHLTSPDAARRYLTDHHVPVPDEQPDATALAELARVRAMVDRLMTPDTNPWTEEGRALLASATYALDAEGRIAATEPRWRGFARNALLPLIAPNEDRAAVQRCANPACRLLFEDSSRNHARRWCDTAGCGNRDRVRRARGRVEVSQ